MNEEENEKNVVIDDIIEKEGFGSKLCKGCKKAGSFIKENAEEILSALTALAGVAAPIIFIGLAGKQAEREQAEQERKQKELMEDPEYWQSIKDDAQRADLYNDQLKKRCDREIERLNSKERK